MMRGPDTFEDRSPQPSSPQQPRTMRCEVTQEPIEELKRKGWEYLGSFDPSDPKQWAEACQLVEDMITACFYTPILVGPQNPGDYDNGTMHLYIRVAEDRQYEEGRD